MCKLMLVNLGIKRDIERLKLRGLGELFWIKGPLNIARPRPPEIT